MKNYEVFCNVSAPDYLCARYKKSFPDFNTALRYAKENDGRIFYVETKTKKLVADCSKERRDNGR